MRRKALEEAGYLTTDYNLILDHVLWVRIASRFPLLHVGDTWALERTHEDAKTVALAGRFVDEAFAFINGLDADPSYEPVYAHESRRIFAGLNVFAARRLIDAREYRRALGYYGRALKLHPPTALRLWYKGVQAAGGALGLEKLFLGYRRRRRALQHAGQRLRVDENGAGWIENDR
jgi:tetratricopeptide (TPR) repeat protein